MNPRYNNHILILNLKKKETKVVIEHPLSAKYDALYQEKEIIMIL